MSSVPLMALAIVVWFPSFLLCQSYGERDTGFRISLSRTPEAPSVLAAALVTTSVYPCEGYQIRSMVTWEKDTISLHILGFTRPTPCIQGGSEATGNASLGSMPDSTFFIRILYRGEIDLHKLGTRKKSLTIAPIRRAFTELRGF